MVATALIGCVKRGWKSTHAQTANDASTSAAGNTIAMDNSPSPNPYSPTATSQTVPSAMPNTAAGSRTFAIW